MNLNPYAPLGVCESLVDLAAREQLAATIRSCTRCSFFGFLSLMLSLSGSWVSAGERPNVIVILADDLGYSDLGCYGGEIETPHIDALAADGARMAHVYNSARCCPT